MNDYKLIENLLHQAEIARIIGDIPNARLLFQAANRLKELIKV